MLMFLWLPLLFLVPFALVRAVRPEPARACCGPAYPYGGPPSEAGVDPVGIARLRLARGEITSAEYEQIRRLIG